MYINIFVSGTERATNPPRRPQYSCCCLIPAAIVSWSCAHITIDLLSTLQPTRAIQSRTPTHKLSVSHPSTSNVTASMMLLQALLIIFGCFCFPLEVLGLQVRKFPLLMPHVQPDRDEFYLCTPIRIVADKSYYIVGFEPNATMNVVHHMMLFGCSVPGTEDIIWDCGEMAKPDGFTSPLQKANPCAEGSHVIYAWARDADPLKLPDDVGFQVGLGTEIAYLVLQVHYSKAFREDQYDSSGIELLYTDQKRSKLAGVLLLATGGSISPHSDTHMEAVCQLREENKTIYPFAYRTHTHSLGKVVAGYKVHKDLHTGFDSWTLLGKRDPLTPQMFYPVFNRDPIRYGDKVAARCTMHSDRDVSTHVGPTNNDEMCNFYLMYYVDANTGAPLDMKYCINLGPPYYYWRDIDEELNSIPDEEASML